MDNKFVVDQDLIGAIKRLTRSADELAWRTLTRGNPLDTNLACDLIEEVVFMEDIMGEPSGTGGGMEEIEGYPV